MGEGQLEGSSRGKEVSGDRLTGKDRDAETEWETGQRDWKTRRDSEPTTQEVLEVRNHKGPRFPWS